MRSALCASSLLVSTLAFAQGPLTPPGAPAPAMRTLAQVEPRTPIPGGTAPFIISTAGSYYLTGNLTVSGQNAITIAASNVTLDLGGFTISSIASPAAATAVFITAGSSNVSVGNGQIFGPGTVGAGGTFSGGGFVHGVRCDSNNAGSGLRAHDLSVSGCAADGIVLLQPGATTGASVAERCTVRHAGGTGVSALVMRGCAAKDCGVQAIYGDTLSDCVGHVRGGSDHAVRASQASNCVGVTEGSGSGLYATTSATNCYGYSEGGAGIVAPQAWNCQGTTATGYAGIAATNATNCTGSTNNGNSSSFGLYANTAVGCNGYYSGTASGAGLFAFSASNCVGFSTNGTGLSSFTAEGSRGCSNNGTGLAATDTASNCKGESVSGPYALTAPVAQNCQGRSTGSAIGLNADYLAANCVGISVSGRGLVTGGATGCFGQTASGDIALLVNLGGTAANCRGSQTSGAGVAISAGIAIGCTSQGGTIASPSKHLGTP